MAVTARLSSRTFSSISVSKISTFARGRHSYAYIASASLLRKKAHSRQWCPALSLKVVATSEHWWEEEEEFDSLTDALARKKIVILIPPVNEEPTDQGQAALAILRGYLHSVNFICGFCGTAEAEFAQALWQGRDKPPLFLKMRTRTMLDGVAAAHIHEFLAEVLQQNWRVELDAGLGAQVPDEEAVLIVCSGAASNKILQHCGELNTVKDTRKGAPGSVSVVNVAGTNAGDPTEWDVLNKHVIIAGQVPGAGQQLLLEMYE